MLRLSQKWHEMCLRLASALLLSVNVSLWALFWLRDCGLVGNTDVGDV